MTPAGIETATFRFVAQLLNHSATAVPISITDKYVYYMYDMFRSIPAETCRNQILVHKINSPILDY